MPQIIIGRTHLIGLKYAENSLYAAEIPIPAPRSLDWLYQMNVYNLCHISLNFVCKYTK